MKHLFYIILILSIAFGTQAQNKKLQKVYTLGKEQLKKQQHQQAMQSFQIVIAENEDNTLTRNAHYFYAQAAFKNKEVAKAEQKFRNILQKYPNWEIKDNIYYNLADIAFQNKDEDLALEYIQKIQNADLQAQARQMLGYYLTQMNILELRLLQQEHEDNKFIAQCLVDKIATHSDKAEDFEFMLDLIEDLDLEKPKSRQVDKVLRIRKPYKVATILPFGFKSKGSANLRKVANHFYQGMRLAQKELDSLESFKLELYAFDVPKNDREKISELIIEKELDDIDLIVGPIFDDEVKLLTDFAETKKVNLIAPFSDNESLLNNRYVYLYGNTPEAQAKAVLDSDRSCFKSNKKIIILYDNLKKNTTLAKAYKKIAEEEGFEIIDFQEVKSYQLEKIKTSLDKSTNIAALLLCSTSQLIAKETVKILENKNNSYAVFVSDAWLKFEDISERQFENRNIHIVYPDFLDKSKTEWQEFRTRFNDFYQNRQEDEDKADLYALKGYEIVYYFARLLQKYGTKNHYRQYLSEAQEQKGKIFNGFDFRESNANLYVPIFKFEDEELVLLDK